MRLTPSDPDIQTLVSRIKGRDINLQPDFQRGEVWSVQKQRRLLDTILRDWHVPPIHIVVVEATGAQEVLDGQQRLAAIRNFINGEFTIDGHIEPIDDEIVKLDGMRYAALPDKFSRRLNGFTIRIFRITDYKPGEPAELFYRLNQPANLTPAEQRNAFYGPAREQVKYLVASFELLGLSSGVLGFSNARMAFDDVVAKVCFTLEAGSLQTKVVASALAQRFRSQQSFSPSVIERIERALAKLSEGRNFINPVVKFNKATLYSWLCFLVAATDNASAQPSAEELCRFVDAFELARVLAKHRVWISEEPSKWTNIEEKVLLSILDLFTDRATSRVADVTSVLIRDLVIWYLFAASRDFPDGLGSRTSILKELHEINKKSGSYESCERALSLIAVNGRWGAI